MCRVQWVESGGIDGERGGIAGESGGIAGERTELTERGRNRRRE
ncbi:hypothetical protein NSQ54_01895 [Alkalihalobacillus sp. FSL W8-0930]